MNDNMRRKYFKLGYLNGQLDILRDQYGVISKEWDDIISKREDMLIEEIKEEENN